MNTAVNTVPATAAPSSGSSSPPTSSGWFALNRNPRVERITIAKTEMTTLARVSENPLYSVPGNRRNIPRPCLHGTHDRLHGGGWMGSATQLKRVMVWWMVSALYSSSSIGDVRASLDVYVVVVASRVMMSIWCCAPVGQGRTHPHVRCLTFGA